MEPGRLWCDTGVISRDTPTHEFERHVNELQMPENEWLRGLEPLTASMDFGAPQSFDAFVENCTALCNSELPAVHREVESRRRRRAVVKRLWSLMR